MKRNLITIIAVLSTTAVAGTASSQTKVGYRVTIPGSSRVYKFTEAKACADTIKKGTEIKEETIKIIGPTTYTYTNKTIPKTDTILLLPKKIKRDLTGDADGRANVYVDEKDKSLLHINYWLNAEHKIPKDTKIRQTLRTLKCKDVYEEKTTEHKLDAELRVQLWKVKLEDWPDAKAKKRVTSAD